jgi:hypothetical protein
MITKMVDQKGRVSLGPRFAGSMVLIDDSNPDQIIIKRAVAIPAAEAWLYKNQAALESVRKGLAQARNGEFAVASPDLDGDGELAAELED